MARSRPDILRDTETTDMISVMEKSDGKHNTASTIPALVEDPVRRVYKRLLAITFLATCSFYILLDLIFQVRRVHYINTSHSLLIIQIQSTVTSSYLTSSNNLEVEEMVESRHEANLATSLYVLLYTQQIINPLIFLYSEFVSK